MKKKIFLAVLGVLLIALAALMLVPAGEIRFEGNNYYSAEELKERIFGEGRPRYLLVRAGEMLGRHKDIPFVERYGLSFGPGLDISVVVYEKALAGYILFQDYYLYFDWDGTLVETSSRRLEDVYEVSGLSISHAVVGEKLPLGEDGKINSILTITQFLNRERIRWGTEELLLGDLAKRIRFGSDGIILELEDIRVLLGGGDNMEAKLFVMADMLPSLKGRKGTLYLNIYRAGADSPSYVFKENE